MHRSRPRSLAILVLLATLILSLMPGIHSTAHTVHAAPHITAGYSGLPQGCVRVTPGDGSIPACCIYGYVWMDGQAVRGATVTITAPNGRSQVVITDLLPESQQPYYQAALSGEPLNVQVGQTITITARYSSHEQTLSYVVQPGGQQVDLTLAKNSAQDYMFERQTIPQLESGKFNDPVSIDHDSSGSLYVLDRETATVQKFDRFGNFILRWGRQGRNKGEFMLPEKITVGKDNAVYIVDTDNHRIQKFSSIGEFILQIGSYGQTNGLLDTPRDVAVDRQGTLYIADRRGVHTFSSDGHYLTTWNEQAYSLSITSTGNIVAYTYPQAISIYTPSGTLSTRWYQQLHEYSSEPYYPWAEDLTIGPNDKIYLSLRNDLLELYTLTGQYIQTIGSSDESSESFVSATYNTDNTLSILDPSYWADNSHIAVRRYSDNGTLISSWGGESRGRGQLDDPYKVRLIGNTFMVFDAQNDRIETFGLDGTWIRSVPLQAYTINDVEFDTGGSIYALMRPAAFSSLVIRKFDWQGNLLQTWANIPEAEWMTKGIDNTFYVLGSGWSTSQSITRFDQNGNILSNWTLPSLPEERYGYDHVAVDAQGNVYVTDGSDGYKFSNNGTLITSWHLGDDYIEGLTIDKDGNIITTNDAWTSPYNAKKFSPSGTLISSWGKYGRDVGELSIRDGNYPSFSSPVTDAQGRVYIPDVVNDRIQVFRPMTYTRPIATINWLNKRSLIQGQDSLSVRGSGRDSDEDGNPSTFTYRWYQGTTLIGTGSTLNINASNLTTGVQTLSLEVIDDEGEISERVSTAIDVSPPPQVAWTFMLYLVADSYPDGAELEDAMNIGFGNGLLARLQQQQRLTPNPNVQVVVQIDSYGYGNTRRLVLNADGSFTEQPLNEQAMDDPDTLEDFVRWAKQTKPASHYYLSIASHGNGYQGVAWDDTSGPTAYLTMAEIGRALENASGDGAAPLDVLHLDACSMGLLDVAYELRDQVRYLVVSQNIGWTFFLQDRYRNQTKATTTPRQLGNTIVQYYADYAEQQSFSPISHEQYPYTISLLDLQRAAPTITELDALARELGAYSQGSSTNRGILANIRSSSQKFDSPEFDYNLTTLDEYVDLVDWAERLQDTSQLANPAVVERAKNVIAAIQGTNPLVVTHANSGTDYSMPSRYGGAAINLSGAHGVSVYYPQEQSRSVQTTIWYQYKTDQLFQLTKDTQWNEFLRAGNTALPSPSTPLPEPGKPTIPIQETGYQVFVPVVAQ